MGICRTAVFWSGSEFVGYFLCDRGFKKGGFAFADDENGNNPLVIRNWGSLDALAGSVSDSKTWVDQAVREKDGSACIIFRNRNRRF